jgi:hypothetical protein
MVRLCIVDDVADVQTPGAGEPAQLLTNFEPTRVDHQIVNVRSNRTASDGLRPEHGRER